MGRTEDCFRSVRRRLDDLGYHQPLSIDSLLLVETLLNDFVELQERLKHYKEVAHHSLETCSELQLGVEPYRQDNARLVRENNQLHQQLLHERDKGDEEKRTLKKQIRIQENEIAELKYLCSNYCQEISDLQQQLAEKTFQLLDLKGVTKSASKSQSGKTFRNKKPQYQEQSETEISGKDTHHLYDKINSLTHDIKLLKEENIELRDAVDKYQDKVRIRDDEIDRLTGLLEGGRPIMAVNKDCCCCCYCRPPASLDYQLVDKNRMLKDQLIECHEKQHEAMCHALELAERNRSLERDLKLLKPSEKACCCGDQGQKLIKMQEKLDCRQLHIDELEQEICGLKKKIKHMDEEKKNADSILEHNLNEKKKLNDRINQLTVIEHDLMLEIERLKRSNALLKSQLAEAEARLIDTHDKVNKLQGSRSSQPAPRADPNTKAVKEPKTIIRTGVRKLQVADPQKTVPKKILKKPAEKKQMEEPKIVKVAHKEKESETSESTSSDYFQPPAKTSSDSPSPPPPSSVLTPKHQSVNENSPSWKDQLLREREIFQKQMEDMERKQAEHCAKFHPPPCPAAKPLQKQPSDSQWLLLERVQAERDYYHKEFSRLRDQLCNIPDHSDEVTDTLKSPINKLEKLLMERDNYHKEVCQLRELCSRLKLDKANAEDLRKQLVMKEQDILTMREKIRTLEHCANLPSVCSKNCQTTIARLELERDTARGDCVRLQEERNCLRNKLQILTETQMREHSRLEHSAMDYEGRIRRLEMERRDLINKEATLRSELKMEQQKNNEFKDQIRVFNADLTQLRTNYNHIKLRQEQSERELCTSQDMLAQTEAELGRAIHRIQELEEERCCQEREIMALKNERSLFKSSIAQIDQEKDSLLLKVDEKTECNVRLEHELKSRDCRIAHLEDIVADLQKKLDLALDGSARSEQNTRQALQESERLRQEIDKLERCRENALIENRRLQDDLAAMTRDWQMSNRNLEISRREVEDLKVQLQGYVTKVHRVEDILQHKEAERTEMLEQFRCLSLEATALESNNHSLESEAKSTKSELREARQKLRDLEENLHCKESLLKGYEVQIRDLTQHIASLERKLACFSDKSERCETELAAARDLSNALECQKQCFSQQIDKLQSENKNLESEVADLNNELDQLKEHLRHERKNSATLETVLASSRQETLQKNMDNNELRVQVQNLHSKICDLQDKLEHGSDALRRCQTETSDYKTQVMELKRQITNERFERARAEEAKGYSTTL